VDSLYRVRRRTRLRGKIDQPETRNEEAMVWVDREFPFRESERGAGLGDRKTKK
jgi:hypothetical protein